MTDEELEKLKARMLKQFDVACATAEDRVTGSAEVRAYNREAAGTLGLAIVAAERELRERAEEKKSFTLVGKEKQHGA